MNLITYKGYPKDLNKIREKVIYEMNGCTNISQLTSVLKSNAEYIDAIDYFNGIRYREVTDKQIKAHFAKLKKKKK